MAAVYEDLAARAMEIVPDGDRRLKALRALLDCSTPSELAQRIEAGGRRRFSKDALEEIEWPSRPRQLRVHEAVTIADGVGVQVSFFLAPVEQLGDVRQ